MIRRKLRRSAAACLAVCALVGAVSAAGSAQTWRWNYVTRTPNAPPLNAQSTVSVGAGKLRMSYTVPLNKRQIVIEACQATLSDVAQAATLQSQGRMFLLVQLKPLRSAACASGRRPAVALPIDDAQRANRIIAGINRLLVTPAPSSAPLQAPKNSDVAASDPGLIPPKLIKRGSSRLAIGITGTALIRLMIGQNGTPQEATIVSISNRRLSAAAIETAVSSTFVPGSVNGRAVAAKYIATFSFDGEDPALSAIPMWKRSPIPSTSSSPDAPEPAVSSLPAAPSPAMTDGPVLPTAEPQPAAMPTTPTTPQPTTSP